VKGVVLAGGAGDASVKRPVSPSSPNTSSVETCRKRKRALPTPLKRCQKRNPASSSECVPATFV
jgi:hypothetical protein